MFPSFFCTKKENLSVKRLSLLEIEVFYFRSSLRRMIFSAISQR